MTEYFYTQYDNPTTQQIDTKPKF